MAAHYSIDFVARDSICESQLVCYWCRWTGRRERGSNWFAETGPFIVLTLRSLPSLWAAQSVALSDRSRNSEMFKHTKKFHHWASTEKNLFMLSSFLCTFPYSELLFWDFVADTLRACLQWRGKNGVLNIMVMTHDEIIFPIVELGHWFSKETFHRLQSSARSGWKDKTSRKHDGKENHTDKLLISLRLHFYCSLLSFFFLLLL